MTVLSYTWQNPHQPGDDDFEGYLNDPYWQGEMIKDALTQLVNRLRYGSRAVTRRSEAWDREPLTNLRGMKIMVELAEDGMTATATVLGVAE